jgi:hypothetical protein
MKHNSETYFTELNMSTQKFEAGNASVIGAGLSSDKPTAIHHPSRCRSGGKG